MTNSYKHSRKLKKVWGSFTVRVENNYTLINTPSVHTTLNELHSAVMVDLLQHLPPVYTMVQTGIISTNTRSTTLQFSIWPLGDTGSPSQTGSRTHYSLNVTASSFTNTSTRGVGWGGVMVPLRCQPMSWNRSIGGGAWAAASTSPWRSRMDSVWMYRRWREALDTSQELRGNHSSSASHFHSRSKNRNEMRVVILAFWRAQASYWPNVNVLFRVPMGIKQVSRCFQAGPWTCDPLRKVPVQIYDITINRSRLVCLWSTDVPASNLG